MSTCGTGGLPEKATVVVTLDISTGSVNLLLSTSVSNPGTGELDSPQDRAPSTFLGKVGDFHLPTRRTNPEKRVWPTAIPPSDRLWSRALVELTGCRLLPYGHPQQ